MAESKDQRWRVTASAAPEGMTELVALREEMRATEGYAIGVDRVNLARTGMIFRANWTQLDSLLGRFKKDPKFALEIWSRSTAEPDDGKWDAFLDALDVMLHNFLAAAGTLVDHTRNIARRRLTGEFWDEYETKKDEAFTNRPRSRFVIDLRNYLLHYSLPAAMGSMSYEQGGTLVHVVTLHIPSLLTWDGWKSTAREYINDTEGENLDAHEVLSGYVEDNKEFHAWFYRHLYEANKDAIDHAQTIADKGNELAAKVKERMTDDPGAEIELPFISWEGTR